MKRWITHLLMKSLSVNAGNYGMLLNFIGADGVLEDSKAALRKMLGIY